MNRPILTLEKSKGDKFLEMLTVVLFVLSVLVVGIFYTDLSERILVDFNWPTKDRDGYVPKATLWISPVIFGVLMLVVYRLSSVPWKLNYPVEIKQGNAKYMYTQARKLLCVINVELAVLCLWITISSMGLGMGRELLLDKYMEQAMLVIMAGTVLFYGQRMVRFKENRKGNL